MPETADGRFVEIAKLDEERRLVFGWANVVIKTDGGKMVDLHDHEIDPATFEEGIYEYVLKSREGGVLHRGEARSELVESIFFTPEKLEKMGLAPDAIPTRWWVGYRTDPETFAKVKAGKLPMFSIEGSARMVEVDD